MENNLKSRNQNLVVQELADETLIYDLATNKTYCLNQTAAFVWKSLDGKTDVKTIAFNLARKANTSADEDIVWLAIDSLKKDNLLANADEVPNRFAGMNRREVVKRIGLATMIALPVVSSLVAPAAANAQSGGTLALNAICTSSGQCQSGNCQAGINSPRCCAATAANGSPTTNNGTSGQPIGCDPGCTRVNSCCSGSARVGPDLAFCTDRGFPSGSSCYCN